MKAVKVSRGEFDLGDSGDCTWSAKSTRQVIIHGSLKSSIAVPKVREKRTRLNT